MRSGISVSVSNQIVRGRVATPSNKSVIKSFKLLSVIREFDRPVSLTEIAQVAKLSVATAHRFIVTLEAVGALRTDSEGSYLLGPSLVELGEQAIHQAAAANLLQRYAQRCASEVGKTVHICMRSGSMVRYVAKAEGQNSPHINTKVGTELEAYCTAVGKVLLAYSQPAVVDRCFDWGGLMSLTQNTITSRNQLRHELAKVKSSEFALDNEEFKEDLRCIAVPIAGHNGEVVASLSVSGGNADIGRHNLANLANQLQTHSRLITEGMRAEDWASV